MAPIDMGDMDLGHGTWDNQAGPDSKDLGGTGRSIHHHHLEADMVHVCAGIHFYYGTCSRWRNWYKPRYRHFSVACSLTSTNCPFDFPHLQTRVHRMQ